ncbi:MAG TPA: Co2+/Mg2+ efflux protein ApaG [Flavobacteriales bacterium]|nr:Co2+/Mg2+ efflux protein ApaG [Flavobacteriales bacterium]
MFTATTHGILVSALPHYEGARSGTLEERFLFSYRITIVNRSQRTVQLLRRHWHITDSMAPPLEVEGPGVVGATPVLEPGAQFSYTSYCELHSELGRMEGTYRMKHVDDGSEFDVAIPAFNLHVPHIGN